MDLLDLATRQRWSSLAARALAHPEEIRLSDASGLSVIHWCCFNRPPLSVIRAILDNDPGEDYVPLVCVSSADGTTPLHAACSSHASPEVIRALVYSHPPSILLQDEMGWTALHYLSGTAFASLSFSEIEGRDAITSAQILIEREPQCVEVVDREGQTALALLAEVMGSHHDPGWQFIRRRIRGNASVESGQAEAAGAMSSFSLEQETAAEVTFWSLSKLLVTAMYQNWCSFHSIPSDELDLPTILHQMSVLYVPKDLIRYTLARHPEQARILCDVGRWKDQLPLHLALRCTSHGDVTIRNILLANRQAARVRDGEGMLPLQLALDAKRRWANGTGRVLIEYPEALQTLGLECSTFPHILHKAMTQSATKSERLLATFRILRSKPDLVQQEVGGK